MDILLHITTPAAAPLASALGRALSAKGATWAVFLTNDGVKALDDAGFAGAAKGAERVAACEHSWDLHMTGECPVERGSQTVNSSLMAEADRVISL